MPSPAKPDEAKRTGADEQNRGQGPLMGNEEPRPGQPQAKGREPKEGQSEDEAKGRMVMKPESINQDEPWAEEEVARRWRREDLPGLARGGLERSDGQAWREPLARAPVRREHPQAGAVGRALRQRRGVSGGAVARSCRRSRSRRPAAVRWWSRTRRSSTTSRAWCGLSPRSGSRGRHDGGTQQAEAGPETGTEASAETSESATACGLKRRPTASIR